MGFSVGDWAKHCQGERVVIVGEALNGNPICEWSDGDIISVKPSHLTPLPGCTGWDWQPPAAAPEPADSRDVVYVCISVKRSVWDAVGDGEDIPAGAAFDGVEMVEIASMPGAKLLLLTE